ncbi:MAG: transposase [Gallionella sp.]|nr:transposase [Gallionella sp.]
MDKARRAYPPLGKMSEYKRAFQSGGCYFFAIVTHERCSWLMEKYAIDRLRNAFRRVMQDRPFAMDAIAILPDHLHCIWKLPEGDNDFPERWRQIKRFVSIGLKSPLNARKEKVLWQRRYWEHLIRNEEAPHGLYSL